MGVYSNTEIIAAREAGHIVIEPFNPAHVNGSSVDVTLGPWFYRTDRSPRAVYNPFDEAAVAEYFGEAQYAIKHKELCRKMGFEALANIDPDELLIMLQPGERILAHTLEFIGIRPPGTTSMHSRSTWGRNGVAVCFDAGWGDPDYFNRWTMEIYNLNAHSIILPVGERIAQIVFHHTGPVEGKYSNLSGKYQASGANVEDLIANWHPSQMLPRAYKDRRRSEG